MAVEQARDQYKHLIAVLAKTDGTLTNPGGALDPEYATGKVKSSDPAILKSMGCRAMTSKYTTMETDFTALGAVGGTDYQVPAGKTAYIYKIYYLCGSIHWYPIIGYGDTAVEESAAAPTNAVGLSPAYIHMIKVTYTLFSADVWYRVPANKYPYAYGVGAYHYILCLFVEV